MRYGLRKSLEDIAFELRGIKNILACTWHSRYKSGETDSISPEVFADEYISTEECARRLGVSDQTIRNWILTGKKFPEKGWVYGVHYINLESVENKKQIIRIPWNRLIQTFLRNTKIDQNTFRKGHQNLYNTSYREAKDSYIPNRSVPKTPDFDEDIIEGG